MVHANQGQNHTTRFDLPDFFLFECYVNMYLRRIQGYHVDKDLFSKTYNKGIVIV